MALYQIVHCVHPQLPVISFFCVHVTVIFVNVMFKVKVAIVFYDGSSFARDVWSAQLDICDRRAAAVDPFISQVACSCTHSVFVTVIAVCMIRRILITVFCYMHVCLFVFCCVKLSLSVLFRINLFYDVIILYYIRLWFCNVWFKPTSWEDCQYSLSPNQWKNGVVIV